MTNYCLQFGVHSVQRGSYKICNLGAPPPQQNKHWLLQQHTVSNQLTKFGEMQTIYTYKLKQP